MSAYFLYLNCHKCKDVKQIRWPFDNVVKLYCDHCNKCDVSFKLSMESHLNELQEVPTKQLIRKKSGIPNHLSYKVGKKEYVYCLFYDDQNSFVWHHLEKDELEFPLLLLQVDMRIRGGSVVSTDGIVLLTEMETFLNELWNKS